MCEVCVNQYKCTWAQLLFPLNFCNIAAPELEAGSPDHGHWVTFRPDRFEPLLIALEGLTNRATLLYFYLNSPKTSHPHLVPCANLTLRALM